MHYYHSHQKCFTFCRCKYNSHSDPSVNFSRTVHFCKIVTCGHQISISNQLLKGEYANTRNSRQCKKSPERLGVI